MAKAKKQEKTIEQRFWTALNNRRLDFISGEFARQKRRRAFPFAGNRAKTEVFGKQKNERS